jgi:NhaA family Na+:H+ antiporter
LYLLIFTFFNSERNTANGWGIPMATDIAFSWLLFPCWEENSEFNQNFLAALAIVDDLGAILVIAIFYTDRSTGAIYYFL